MAVTVTPRHTIQRDITFKRNLFTQPTALLLYVVKGATGAFVFSLTSATPILPRYQTTLPAAIIQRVVAFIVAQSRVSHSYSAPANRYQMEKIELVTATLIIIVRPLTFSPLSVRHGPRSYHFRPTYRSLHVRERPPVIAVIFPTLISCKTFQLRSSSSLDWPCGRFLLLRAQSESATALTPTRGMAESGQEC